VLIFLNREAQEGICEKMYDALNPGGVMVLGRAESPTKKYCNKGFVPLCRQNRVFQKIEPHGEEKGLQGRSMR
ncbi:MAG: hypothetical protein CO150_06495, partial [Nitrospirae bacterium CG_4_9_14_3_um_filter_53_35]